METASQHTQAGPIQIDLGQVIARRMGNRVPGFVVRRLEKLIRQDRLNEMLRVAYPRRGAAFCEAVLDHLDVHVNVEGTHNLPEPSHRRVILVSNHPLGGLDGMALIAMVTRHFGCEPYFVVNDLLMAVEPLSGVFLPINKHGAQSRESIRAIDDAMAGDRPVLVFPAGLCSRQTGGRVADLGWQKMFVQKARRYGRDIVPLRFDGTNSPSFYRTARWRSRLGIRFNIEMALLPGEIFKAAGKEFTVHVGPVIPHAALGDDAAAEALRIRKISDNLQTH